MGEVFGPLGWAVVVVVAAAILLIRDHFTTLYCPDCDASLPKGAEVCTYCGYDFEAEERPRSDTVDLRLADEQGSSFELAILNYQFPRIGNDEWDSNRLLVRMEGRSPERSWTNVDSCLLTWEVADLAEWVAALGDRRRAESKISFTELTLALSSNEAEDGRIHLVIRLVLGSPQPHQPEEVEFPLTVDREQLRDGARSLSVAMKQFPVRARGHR